MGTRILLQRIQVLLGRQLSVPTHLATNIKPCLWALSTQAARSQPLTTLNNVKHENSKFTCDIGTNESVTVTEPDPITDKILKAQNEEAIFDVLTENKLSLTNVQVFAAIDSLWELQKQKPDDSREFSAIVEHPEFSHLCETIEKNFHEFDSQSLIKTLYAVLRLQMDPSCRTVQQLVIEGQRRFSELDFSELSRFGVCLSDMGLHTSPIMGQLTGSVHEKLDQITNVREFSNFINLCIRLSSSQSQIKLANKAMELCSSDVPSSRDIRRILRALTFVKFCHKPLLEKCTSLLLDKIDDIEPLELCIVHRYLALLGFEHEQFKKRLIDRLTAVYSKTDNPTVFAGIFEALASDASSDLKLQLEDASLGMIPQMSIDDVVRICNGLRHMNYRSSNILKSVARFLKEPGLIDSASSNQCIRIAKTLTQFNFKDSKVYKLLGEKLSKELKNCLDPHNVSHLLMVLVELEVPLPNTTILSKVSNSMHHFNVVELNRLSSTVKEILQDDELVSAYHSEYTGVLQELSRNVVKKLDDIRSIHLFNDFMQTVVAEGPDLGLIDELMQHYNKMLHKVNPQAAVDCTVILLRARYLHKPLLDTIAKVVIKYPHKINFLNIKSLLLVFANLNYQPPSSERFLRTCKERVESSLDRYDPHFLIKIAHAMALQQKFSAKVTEQVFSLDFLAKLDDVLKEMPPYQASLCRMKLMQVNRALRIECPESKVPWFHDEYCELLLKKRSHTMLPNVLKDIQGVLSEVVGGAAYMRSWVVTPYYYNLDFECVLDANKTPLVCADYGSVLNKSSTMSTKVLADLMQWGSHKKELPPGAQRIAIDFLTPRHLCTNSRHPLGQVEMKKRHLEIMGYRYVMIPHYEWFSMRLSTREDFKNYLREKIFGKTYTGPDESKEPAAVYKILSSLTR
ncbi:FAST kinase domain-containing protein 1, mitochondrial-like [Glandiceps talaboti]